MFPNNLAKSKWSAHQTNFTDQVLLWPVMIWLLAGISYRQLVVKLCLIITILMWHSY